MAKDIKPITEIKQNGNDFVITSKTPGKTVTNSFTIGKEAEITTMDGKKLKVCLLIVVQFFCCYLDLHVHDLLNVSHIYAKIAIM